jgi:hypothetical protein
LVCWPFSQQDASGKKDVSFPVGLGKVHAGPGELAFKKYDAEFQWHNCALRYYFHNVVVCPHRLS